MSWNIWWRFGDDWRARQDRVVEVLKALRPDVVGLQEVWSTPSRTQADVLAAELGMHAAFAPESFPPVPSPPEHPDQAGADLGVAVLSRWPVVRQQAKRLPSTRRHRPPALLVTVDHPLGPLHVCSVSTEWSSTYADDHLAQTEALADLVTNPTLDGDLPVVIAGDLRAGPDADALRPLLRVTVDAWTLGGGQPDAATRCAVPGAPRQPQERVDYLLLRPGRPGAGVSVRDVALAGRTDDEPAPSNHLAVAADIVLDG